MTRYQLFWKQSNGDIATFERDSDQPQTFLKAVLQAGISMHQWCLLWGEQNRDWTLIEDFRNGVPNFEHLGSAETLPVLSKAAMTLRYHYKCGMSNCGQKWSIVNSPPEQTITCPHCGQKQAVPIIVTPRSKP